MYIAFPKYLYPDSVVERFTDVNLKNKLELQLHICSSEKLYVRLNFTKGSLDLYILVKRELFPKIFTPKHAAAFFHLLPLVGVAGTGVRYQIFCLYLVVMFKTSVHQCFGWIMINPWHEWEWLIANELCSASGISGGYKMFWVMRRVENSRLHILFYNIMASGFKQIFKTSRSNMTHYYINNFVNVSIEVTSCAYQK